MTFKNHHPVIIALDFNNERDTWSLVDQLSPDACKLKVGKELFTACGPQLVKNLVSRNFDIFLDLKFHDIPNTVAHALKAARDLGVWMVNVHASGGSRMMHAARAALNEKSDPLLIAVTVLTSMEQQDLQQIGISTPLEQHILALAKLAVNADLDGVVCSAMESAMLRAELGAEFCLVTPGIRPAGSDSDDQRRIVTPKDAINAGSHFLVIGRPVTQATNPAEALRAINLSLSSFI
jgi:orotidine-5'-phosphate decarboxylase